MTFEINLQYRINVPIEYVFDWWTDLSPSDTFLAKPLKSRQIISRTPQTIILKDEEQMYFRKMSYNVRVALDRPNGWMSEYDGVVARAKSEYVLKSISDKTTIILYHARIEPKGFLTRAFSPIVKPFVKRVFASEMKVFILALTEDYQNGRAAVTSADFPEENEKVQRRQE